MIINLQFMNLNSETQDNQVLGIFRAGTDKKTCTGLECIDLHVMFPLFLENRKSMT